jgi:hypothetical protein
MSEEKVTHGQLGPMLQKSYSNLPQWLHLLSLKFYSKLQWHLSLPPWANAIKLLPWQFTAIP